MFYFKVQVEARLGGPTVFATESGTLCDQMIVGIHEPNSRPIAIALSAAART
jgi:hypothetical protein